MDGADPLERKIVTILFADLVGFTTLSEQLDPEDVASVQGAYFAAARETVGRYGGRLEKFIGDAVMAVFGAPTARDDDAERAVRAGLALTSAVEQLGAEVGLDDGALQVRVGVNTGEVAVHPGASAEEALVTGDVVNVAARLQSAAPPGGVVVGETTNLAVADAFVLEPLGGIELKGKAEPVPAWTVVDALAERSREHAMGGLRAPLLGRADVMDDLLAALQRVAGGEPERWLVIAAPGVGKTRLLESLATRATDGGAAVLLARLRPDVIGPYQAVAQLLAGALRPAGVDAGSSDDARRAAFDTIFGRVTEAGGSEARARVVAEQAVAVTWPSEHEPTAGETLERETRFAAWLEALDALIGPDTTALWLVEDLHWGGHDLLAFLDHARANPGRRLVVTTARPSVLELDPEWASDLPSERRRSLHLPQLSAPDAGQLIRALIGDVLPSELAAAVVDRSDGTPLFIEELLRTWVSVGVLVPDGAGWRLTAEPEDILVPATVRSIYAAQIDDLPPSARLAARRASVAGRRFPRASLEPLEVPDADDALDGLHRRALVTGPEEDPFAGPTFAFRHVLLRDAGYASLARSERARLHVRLARWIEHAAGDRAPAVAEVVARHYEAALAAMPALAREVAEGLDRVQAEAVAAIWFERAGNASAAMGAHDAARTLLGRSIELTLEGDAANIARRWERLGEVTAFSADMDEGTALLRNAMTRYRWTMTDGPEDGRAEARSGYARTAATLGRALDQQLRFHQALQLARTVLAEIGPAEDVETGAMLVLEASQTIHTTDTVDEPERQLRRALAIAEATGDRTLELDAREWLTLVRADREDVGSEWREIEELAVREGRWTKAVEAIRMQSSDLLDDRAGETWAVLDRAEEVAEAHGLTERRAWIDYERAEAGLVSGDWDRAVDAGMRAIDLAERNAYHRAEVRTWFALLPILQERADADGLRRAHAWFAEHRPPATAPWQMVMVAAAHLRFADAGLEPPAIPEPEGRLAAFRESQIRPSWFAGAERVIRSWIDAGRIGPAAAAIESAAPARMSRLGRGVYGLLEARLAAAAPTRGAQDSDAAALVRRSLDAFRTVRAPRWILAAIRDLERTGDATAEESDEARRIAGALGVA